MTLVEVMMAFAILIVGLVGIFAILNAGFRSHKRAINDTEATILASSILDELRSDFFRGRVPPSDAKSAFTESTTNAIYKYNRLIFPLESKVMQAGPVVNREYFVRVEVRWSEQGESKSVGVESVMFYNKK